MEENKDNKDAEVVKTAAEVGAGVFAGPMGAKAVDIASRTKLGKNVLNKSGQIISNVSNTIKQPLGIINQNSFYNNNDSSSTLDRENNGIEDAAGASSNILKKINLTGKDKNKSKKTEKNILAIFKDKKKLKMYLIIGGAAVSIFMIMFLIMAFAPNTGAMLDLTEEYYNPTDKSSSSGGISTASIEEHLLYVGDSRTHGMSVYVDNSAIQFIALDGAGYKWLSSTALSKIESLLSDSSSGIKYVVFNFGINDLGNINNYINTFNYLKNKYTSVQFYYMSVNPVDEVKARNNGYTVTNKQIESFNSTLSSSLGSSYIDVYSELTSFSTNDGIHYTSGTYTNIHSKVVSYISSQNPLKCGGSFTNYYQYNYSNSYAYGTIASYGCGPTAMAMVLTYYLDKTITPVETAKWSMNHKTYDRAGTTYSFFNGIAYDYNIYSKAIAVNSASITKSLQECKKVIILVVCTSGRTCEFTKKSHYIVLTGIDSDGMVSVADPNSSTRSTKKYSVSFIIKESGGEAWEFSEK
jgi:hypothetical protein